MSDEMVDGGSACVYRNPWCLSGVAVIVFFYLLLSAIFGFSTVRVWGEIKEIMTMKNSVLDLLLTGYVFLVLSSGAALFGIAAAGSIIATYLRRPLIRYIDIIRLMQLWWKFLVVSFILFLGLLIAPLYYDNHYGDGAKNYQRLREFQEQERAIEIQRVGLGGYYIWPLLNALGYFILSLIVIFGSVVGANWAFKRYQAKCVSVCKSKTSLATVLWDLDPLEKEEKDHANSP